MKKHTTLKSKFNSAFSLVELLVVIAVIAVIAAIAIPNIAGINEAAGDARNQRNAQLLSSTFNNSVAAGNTNTYADETAAADSVIDGYTNATTGISFRVDGIASDADRDAALTYITYSGGTMNYNATPGS